jgi:hypothetical protein
MKEELTRMYHGVGSSTADTFHRLFKNPFQVGFEHFPNAYGAFLSLPTMIIDAVIRNVKEISQCKFCEK